MTIGIILGSTRHGRVGEAVAHWVDEAAQAREGFDYALIDLIDFRLPLFDAETVPMAANKSYDSAEVTRWSEAIDACEAFIFVTPEYNHSVPAALKNAVDSLGSEWSGKPVAFVGYGAVGGVRAVEHWRQITANFEMPNVRNQVAVSIMTEFPEGRFTPAPYQADALTAVFDDLEALITRLR
ncbi:NAD(P)H-dependent oxidoreductase [Corynebacterium sanguinis]|uniref:NADPH-dependent FMN reductase n=1 Tax=Corynebacterium sanguinis TaxID=2594913 RepID=UPI00223C2CCE|nr:NAD(P)H-dependent oxidoreductase [Corynebacterium sanguinis]MCT1411701.1 NAD(P)H-dependent oxidoreductase [Corynebacterium sanguinis]MCT1413638.1 NAD(P)H-dependent oxidoreductase [Corynebacterium sanguinis]MCT1425365.1 NAD(P)H-dependent oxidoreductase [Corynebacterium sanguinis]MCT1444231.1 NAD(P)H-dependent oxidoreductase [Corynebacterium sanguinis]MCT1492789.1 NAD(P)H-dependent oxidoreductase [Corynebacterium sanguinis]